MSLSTLFEDTEYLEIDNSSISTRTTIAQDFNEVVNINNFSKSASKNEAFFSVIEKDILKINSEIIEPDVSNNDLGNIQTHINGGITLKSLLDKAQIKSDKFLSTKTISLTKHLDSYGVVDSIISNENRKNSSKTIHARIYDVSSNEFIDEISFLSDEFSLSDQSKLVENCVFYWHVGVEKNIFGSERNISEFRLKRTASR
ncbi:MULTISPECIES: hypothetical protein [unclassified Enterobacter]|uniref:hypothetical protein n=1 Tax=unclassified Enterobacter TaxID=2608935 RepID=UPI0021479197|nr:MULTISPECIES: hypothetical protein [unclassified Enterobacter]MCR1304586.1 hypothetical protein [Enterobacter sp. FL1277]MCR1309810.1 hypothetical protein [Enterobacter sp. BT1271]MCR1314925.1 hypothetical protein [Enterobacter sp. BT855]MCR1325451.1 hypothetical protein [Enterobacter sp. BT1268]MCR1330596.1 hypothetical protein [Enterobacter sp. BT1131]